ncbi:MAG: hypothetical protein WD066_09015 [Planctomycetaceae bacterium]
MQTKLPLSAAAIALTLACATHGPSSAEAAAFDPAHVSAEAKWVLHYDVDASRETAYGKKFHEEHVATEQGREKLNWVKDRYGIDLERDLHGFTAYGNDYEPHSGTLLMHSKFDAAKIEAVVKEEPDHRTSRHGNHTIHTWTAKLGRPGAGQADDDAEAKGRPLSAALVANRVVVIAAGEQSVKAALDVLDGKAPTLRGKESPLVFEVSPGTFFQGAAFSLTDLKQRPRPFPVLQESNSARMTFGERDGRTSFAFRLDAGDAQRASQVATMGEGFQAMIQLHAEARPELKPIAEGLSIQQADGVVETTWTVATDAVLKLAEQAKAEREARRAPRDADSKDE